MSNKIFSNNTSIASKDQDYFRRPHIHNLLAEAIQKPMVMVIAGAGYGKTQAVYAFLQEYSATTIWLQLTTLDNISERFWKNFINSISLQNIEAASNFETFGFPETDIKFDMVLYYALEIMNFDNNYIFVFDDFYLIHDKKVLRFIEKLINASIPNLSIVIISRNEPEINIIGLLAKGQLSIICENDLRFSKSDMIGYFKTQGIHMSPRALAKTYDSTEGWIMAIRLVELSLKKEIAREDYALTSMKLNVFKLMESEIFGVISEETQLFLIKMSLFSSLPLDLVKVLASDNERLIIDISRVNSFVRYDSFLNTYCIHHLFLDFLKQKQDMLKQNERVECYQKAANWYTLNGYEIDALTYFEQAGTYSEILNTALLMPYALSEGVAILLLDILSRAPEKAYKQEPLLAILRVRALASIGREKEAKAELVILRSKYEVLPKTQENCSILCEVYIVAGVVDYVSCLFTNNISFPDLFTQAFRYMPEGSAAIKGKYNSQNVGAYVCRINSEKKEDTEKYIKAIKIGVHYASKVMYGCMYGLDDLSQAELAYFNNSMKNSERFAYQAIYKARVKKQYEIEIRALFYLIRISVSAGNYIKITDLLKQLDLQLETVKFPNSHTLYDIVTSWFYSLIGQSDKISDWIKNDFYKCDFSPVVSGVENLAKIKYYLSEKKYYELLAFTESEENMYGIKCFLFGKIAILAYRAICLYHTKEKVEAVKNLQIAYYLAEPNSLTMQFIELGNDMVSLAKFALKSEACTIPYDWLQDILRKSSTYAKRLSHIASEYKKARYSRINPQQNLTKRELEFLNDICHGMLRVEIATSRGLSLNYVKNRLQAIYAKLGAKNSIDAVRIATVMKLIK